MQRRIAFVGITAAFLFMWVVPAEAASPKPLRMTEHTVIISPPLPPPTPCDEYSAACGEVTVTVEFSGLDGRLRPTEPRYQDGNLSGSAQVKRVYGCQDANGKRLKRFDRRVTGQTLLNTPHGFGYSIPPTGNTLGVTVYYPLFDAQPGNCPAGTQAMIYKIEVSNVKLQLESIWAPIPSADYRTHGRTEWYGAVPTPTPPPATSTG